MLQIIFIQVNAVLLTLFVKESRKNITVSIKILSSVIVFNIDNNVFWAMAAENFTFVITNKLHFNIYVENYYLKF